jgi:predicted nucleic acid-binding protein
LETAQAVIHLDSSFLIRAGFAGSAEDAQLRHWLADGEHLGASAVAWAEYLCGPVSVEDASVATTLIDEPEPLDSAAASVAARLFNETGRRRGSLADCMIAATAIQADAELATADLADFRRYEPLGLRLVALR